VFLARAVGNQGKLFGFDIQVRPPLHPNAVHAPQLPSIKQHTTPTFSNGSVAQGGLFELRNCAASTRQGIKPAVAQVLPVVQLVLQSHGYHAQRLSAAWWPGAVYKMDMVQYISVGHAATHKCQLLVLPHSGCPCNGCRGEVHQHTSCVNTAGRHNGTLLIPGVHASRAVQSAASYRLTLCVSMCSIITSYCVSIGLLWQQCCPTRTACHHIHLTST
jgi:hypothetical protein